MSNKAVKTYQVDITSNPSVIKVTAEPIASNIAEAFPIANIVQVTPVYYDFSTAENNSQGNLFREGYPYPKMTKLIIESLGGKKLDIECQSITNQSTWSTGLKTGLIAAAAAINALL